MAKRNSDKRVEYRIQCWVSSGMLQGWKDLEKGSEREMELQMRKLTDKLGITRSVRTPRYRRIERKIVDTVLEIEQVEKS